MSLKVLRMTCDKSISEGIVSGTYIRKGFKAVGAVRERAAEEAERQQTRDKAHGRWQLSLRRRNDNICGCLFHLAHFIVSIKSVGAFLILYLSLFAEYSEKAVTINFHIQQANSVLCLSLLIT